MTEYSGVGRGRNRLQYETSPYLRQHADNPVDWFSWSDEAFHKASIEDKPIFLSVGYSSCHWCHVMEEESFSHEDVAALLNEAYIAVKVDREERPDVDHVYMTIAQAAVGQGGWPLTVIMAPDGKPFFLGTYLPRESLHGGAGLMDLLTYVSQQWKEPDRRAQLLKSASDIVSAVQRMVDVRGGDRFPADAGSRACAALAASFDAAHGGFGVAPKFPTPERLRFLMGHWRRTGAADALAMATATLDAMRRGGIYDHVGGGFHRYSVDERWAVPHFEKMLYDQALLAYAYLDAYLATGRPWYASTVRDVLGYVRRRLTSPEGGFFCAEDADTADGEGAYYLWSVHQLRQALDTDELEVILASAGIRSADGALAFGSAVPDDESLVLAFINPPEEVAAALALPLSVVDGALSSAVRKLFAVRERREPVVVDDKVTADWNGLAIGAFARAGAVLGEAGFIDVAKGAADLIMAGMVRPDGALMHTYKDETATVPGFLDDYAAMACGLLEVYQSTFDIRYLRFALELVDRIVVLFRDEASGLFDQTGGHGERLVLRSRSLFDGALPSGNALAVRALVVAARLTARADLATMAESLFSAAGSMVDAMPEQYASLMSAHALHEGGVRTVVVTGDAESPATRALLAAARAVYAPDVFLLSVRPGAAAEELAALLPWVRDYLEAAETSAAHVCDSSMCWEPTSDPEALRAMLL